MSKDQKIYDKYNLEHIPAEKYSLNQASFKVIDFKGKKLNTYIDGPENGPKLFFIHGFNFFVEMYSPLINELIQTYRVLSVDLPGHGHTDMFDEYSANVFQETILATLDHYEFKDFVLSGHSMGGQLSLMCVGDQRFSKYNISKTVAFCPAGIKIITSFGQKCMKSRCIAKCASKFAFKASMAENAKRTGKILPSDMSKSFFDMHMSYVLTEQHKYVDRQTKQIQEFPWESAQNEFKTAKDKNVLVVLATDEQYVDTQATAKFINKECKNWVMNIEKGLHEIPMLRPQWATQVINEFKK
ncbi:Alpha/beta_hydrolase family protein [Hexamita inflata]|uniref:Alpha/beta hydrolase family protein n=1 Tax=Hexamita inflata TaxID=28002 RepID=A0AA86NFM3_9EUKA|nr:Alpha/beta hydrolase family protein [Hexamita inflata]